MKKMAIACALLSSVVASSVWADAASSLKSRLDKVSSFHATFTQKVTDGSGAAVQEGQGDLWVKRPNLFNWHMTQPDESILVSDGKTLWFYNPVCRTGYRHVVERCHRKYTVYADCPQPGQRLAAV